MRDFPSVIFFRQETDGRGILGRSHVSHFLKLSGEIVDRGIAQAVGNLSKIQLIAADQLFGGVDLHQGKKFHDAAAVKLLKQFLKAGAAYQCVLADFFDGQLFTDMFLHVTDNPIISFIGMPHQGASQALRYGKRIGKIPAVKVDQKFFQIVSDQLFRPEAGRNGVAHQLFLVRIIQPSQESPAGLDDDLGQKSTFRVLDRKDLPAEGFHGRRAALEGDDYQAGGDTAVGDHVVEFIGLVEDDAASFQSVAFLSCHSVDLAFVHTEKLPEIMALPGESKVAHIVEIMDRNDIADGQGGPESGAFICHGKASLNHEKSEDRISLTYLASGRKQAAGRQIRKEKENVEDQRPCYSSQ